MHASFPVNPLCHQVTRSQRGNDRALSLLMNERERRERLKNSNEIRSALKTPYHEKLECFVFSAILYYVFSIIDQ